MKELPVFCWGKKLFTIVPKSDSFFILKAYAWNAPESVSATAKHTPLLIKLTACLLN